MFLKRVVFCSPEQLMKRRHKKADPLYKRIAAGRVCVALLVFDEAHTLASWYLPWAPFR